MGKISSGETKVSAGKKRQGTRELVEEKTDASAKR